MIVVGINGFDQYNSTVLYCDNQTMESVEVNQTFYFYKGKKKIKSKPSLLGTKLFKGSQLNFPRETK